MRSSRPRGLEASLSESEPRPKRILVTGGAGFMAANTIRYLLEKTPHEVVTMDALTYAANLDNLSGILGHERLRFIYGDIRSLEDVTQALLGVDIIIAAAAESHVEKSITCGGSEFVTTNVVGTQVLLDAARFSTLERFILISSSEAYGSAEMIPMSEKHPLLPRSPYAATKAAADRLAYSYFITYQLPIVILRPFNNYGPCQHVEKLIPRFITQALAGEPLTLHGSGQASRDWIHVSDTARAIHKACQAPLEQIVGETINIATGCDQKVEDIATMILALTEQPEELKHYLPDRPGQVARHLGSTAKAADLLDFRAQIPFAEGLEKTLHWYREHRSWWDRAPRPKHSAGANLAE